MRVTADQLRERLYAATGRHPLRIVKAADTESRYVLGLAYGPHRLDGNKEFMRPEHVEKTAWGFMAEGGRQIGLHHADGTLGHADVVESYVYRGPDWEMTDSAGRTQIIKAGDWLLGAVFDPPAWRLVKSGRVTGWSIDGMGRRIEVPRAQADLREST